MRLFEGYYKGVNLGGWLSQCVHTKEHYDSFINENDIRTLSTWGIDHLRLPIDYNLVETENGEYIESGFDYIQNTINWCGKYGLNLVLDLHKTFGYSFDKGENESGFLITKIIRRDLLSFGKSSLLYMVNILTVFLLNY